MRYVGGGIGLIILVSAATFVGQRPEALMQTGPAPVCAGAIVGGCVLVATCAFSDVLADVLTPRMEAALFRLTVEATEHFKLLARREHRVIEEEERLERSKHL